MLLAYCGTVPNPWKLPHPLQDIITELWLVIFPQFLYDEQLYGSGTPVFLVASVLWHLFVRPLD